MPDRRTILATLAALPVTARAAPAVKPPRLRAGDTVALIEPAGLPGDRFDIADVEATIRAMGLVPRRGRHLLARHGYLAGTDAERAADLNDAVRDPAVRALFAVRGGWGCARILPRLDWAAIRANPKLLIGFSDITALHLAYAAMGGPATIHGPNAGSSWGRLSWEAFRAIAFDAGTPTFTAAPAGGDRLAPRPAIRTFRGGTARGPLLGGNLTVLAALAGTAYLPRFDGAILFLEDTNEAEYRIDRMVTQLHLAGHLARLAGVAFGQCTACNGAGSGLGGFTLSEVLEHHLRPLGIPAFQGATFGHIANQISLPLGIAAEIDADAGTIRLLEPAVT